MPEGGRLTIRVQAKDAQRLGIVFQDTGVGMTAAELSRAFEPFYSTKGDRGTGLGLAICRQLLDIYGGNIHLMSKKGEGTTASIELQFSALPAAESAPVA
jgi:signal transduction histidine kinase